MLAPFCIEMIYDAFQSNTPPKVPMTGSQDGVSIDSIIIPANYESVKFMLSPHRPLLVSGAQHYDQVMSPYFIL